MKSKKYDNKRIFKYPHLIQKPQPIQRAEREWIEYSKAFKDNGKKSTEGSASNSDARAREGRKNKVRIAIHRKPDTHSVGIGVSVMNEEERVLTACDMHERSYNSEHLDEAEAVKLAISKLAIRDAGRLLSS